MLFFFVEYVKWLDIWCIGESCKCVDKKEGMMKFVLVLAYVLRVEFAGTRYILCSVILLNGKMIVVSDVYSLRLFDI